jgi:hypothetical protein
VDADNRYAPGVFAFVADRLRADSRVGLIFAVGESDRDPSVTRFYAWRREAFERAGRYPDRQEREDPPLLLRAFRAGFGVERALLPRVADDLKPREAGHAPSVAPWRRGSHTMWAARRFRVLGFRYAEYARLLSLTRRTAPRLAAGLVLGGLAYILGALLRDDNRILELNYGVRPPPAPRSGSPSEAPGAR